MSDGERQMKLRSLTRLLLTSCCAAWFLTDRGQVPVHSPGVGDPCLKGCLLISNVHPCPCSAKVIPIQPLLNLSIYSIPTIVMELCWVLWGTNDPVLALRGFLLIITTIAANT